MLWPPGVVFEATLEDVSRADAMDEVIGQARDASTQTPPFRSRWPSRVKMPLGKGTTARSARPVESRPKDDLKAVRKRTTIGAHR